MVSVRLCRLLAGLSLVHLFPYAGAPVPRSEVLDRSLLFDGAGLVFIVFVYQVGTNVKALRSREQRIPDRSL